MSDERVTVDFPKKMTVESPSTDKKIDAQISAFKHLSKMLQTAFREIADSLQTLRVLPELIRGFQDQVSTQFDNMFRRGLEGQVYGRHASLRAQQTKRDAMLEMREAKIGELPVDRRRISNRYLQMIEKAADHCDKQIGDLDSHALDIVDKVYPKQIEERFSYDSLPTFEFFAAQADESAEARTLCLGEGFGGMRGSASSLINERAAFYDELNEVVADKALKPGWYEVPYVLVEVEDIATGAREIKFVYSGTAEGGLPQEVAARLGPPVLRKAECCTKRSAGDATVRAVGAKLSNEIGVVPSEVDRLLADGLLLLEPGEGTAP